MLRTALLFSGVFATSFSSAEGQEAGSVLFVRGADRSGGFLEAGNDNSRTEQLADISNQSQSGGNHGWFEFATLLESNGYLIEQAKEPLESGAPSTGQTTGAALSLDGSFSVIDRFGSSPGSTRQLSDYDAVVFGSNNAVYGSSQIDAVESYIRGGGGALFISDANFGSSWSDASNSDQQFLDRFGLIVNQDRGTTVHSSAEVPGTPNDYSQNDHPILNGVDAFDGEGVTPFQIGTLTNGVTAEILVKAEGNTSDNTGTSTRGASRPVTDNDAALLIALADAGRIAGHFDRNTFFNANGAGSSLFETQDRRQGVVLDNDEYALNLVGWVVNIPEPTSFALLCSGGLLLLRRRCG
ncbi:PEP-CTERM sorting domain-containing protein [Algisphaera agarilytica]|uniref:PEP-CTERM sorting domain-containing protein n=1 Tax=Algisphaera agarilytica TaxID=1385975 RepID=UPI001C8823A4|nr:PEP-CTERM sorting domain-containing protein [Algisphaera agarilytica]